MPVGFDWDGVMRACMGSQAVGGLGWTPRTFWQATPREVAAALGERTVATTLPPTRDVLEALLARHPDSESSSQR